MGFRSQTKFWNGIINDSTILTWNGLNDSLKFDVVFQQLFSGSDGVSLQMDVVMERNENVQEEDFKLRDKISVPFGSCKLYEGTAIRNLYFKIKEEEIAEYIVFVSDSSAALIFQARLISLNLEF